MANFSVAGRQFFQQNTFRSITIGLQPYLPITQKYKMGLLPATGPVPGFGYFNMGPSPTPTSTPPKAWSERINEGNTGAYQRTPKTGNPNNFNDALTQADSLSGAPAAAQNLGFLFSRILDGKMAGGFGRRAAGFRQTDVNEIEAMMLGEELEKLDPKTFKGKNSELNNDILFEKNTKGMSSETFDIMFSERGGSGIQQSISGIFGKEMTKGSVGVEVSVAKAGTQGVKLFSRFGKNDMKKAGGIDKAFETNVRKIVKDINADILKAGKRFDKQAKYGDSIKPVLARESFGTSTLHDKFTRELIDRVSRLAKAGSGQAANELAYNYQVPLGSLAEGMMGMVRLAGTTKNGWPQILATNIKVKQVGGGGNMADMMKTNAQENELAMGADFMIKADLIHQASANLAIATDSRIDSVGTMMTSDLTQNAIGGLDIAVGERSTRGDGVTGLLPADIAADLLRQIKEFYSNPGFTTDFALFYKKLLHDSGDLSTKWRESAQGKGRGMSEKFIYGDNDPQFKGYGVWSGGQYSWQDGLIGQNLSISPFLTSRRAGVYAFDGKQATI
tara:strand:+ start:517 stop:2196 length:1680 start_codon:yes stop_codon:yes gene_type:complete